MYVTKITPPYMGLGSDGLVRAEAFLDIFQEAATLHAGSLGCGVGDLLKRGYTWVLRRYSVLLREPTTGGDASVSTWYAPERDLFSIREFCARDASGTVAAEGWSAWILLDISRGRPVRLDRGLPPQFFENAEQTSPCPADRKLADVRGADFTSTFDIRRCEIDMNGHVNHTVYFTWAIETIPHGETEGMKPTKLDAEYFHAAKAGEVECRAVRISDEPRTYAHSIAIKETGEEAARVVTVWS